MRGRDLPGDHRPSYRPARRWALRWIVLAGVLGTASLLLLLPAIRETVERVQQWGRPSSNVLRVIDGDTIEVRLDGRVERVRYIGIDTPELKHPTRGAEPGGRDAMELNRQLIAGKNVRLELDVQERDRYGRLLAYVWVKQEGEREVMVNAALLWHGYAQVMTIAPNVKYADYLHELQRQARETRRGLWGNALGGGGIEPSGSDISPSARVGVPPQDPWTCPPSHPVKGNFTTYSGERCIYHVPGGEFYDKTKPERCYAMEQDAGRDGCRRSRR